MLHAPHQTTFDRKKLEALLHYVVWKSAALSGAETSWVQRVMWFSDALAFVETGLPLTGSTYVRGGSGPVTQHFARARASLERDAKITAVENDRLRDGARFRSLVDPKASTITEVERRLVERAIAFAEASASGPKLERPWEFVGQGEEIPFVAALARRIRAPRGEELAWAKQVAEKLKLR